MEEKRGQMEEKGIYGRDDRKGKWKRERNYEIEEKEINRREKDKKKIPGLMELKGVNGRERG